MVAPDRTDDAEGDRDPKDEAPVDDGQEATGDQADERSADRGDLVDAHRHAALVRREGVDEDRARVREEHRSPDALDEPPQDEPQRAGATVIGVQREEHRRQGEHGEAEVVDAHPAHDVAERTEADHQHRGHEEVALQEPQQVAHVAGRQGIDADPAEDRRQRDQDDRRVDGRHEDAQGRIGEGYPFVTVTVHRVQGFGCHRSTSSSISCLTASKYNCALPRRPRRGRIFRRVSTGT